MWNVGYLQSCECNCVFRGCCGSLCVCVRALGWTSAECVHKRIKHWLKRVYPKKTWWVCSTNSLSGVFPRLKDGDLGSVLCPLVTGWCVLRELISGQIQTGAYWRFLSHWGEASRYPDVVVFRLYYEQIPGKNKCMTHGFESRRFRLSRHTPAWTIERHYHSQSAQCVAQALRLWVTDKPRTITGWAVQVKLDRNILLGFLR